MTTVGIIANPASGKDIRRLVAHGSVFNNQEKVYIVRRVLLGLQATGVEEVIFMPDTFNIGERAIDGLKLSLKTSMLQMTLHGTHEDSSKAAERFREMEVGCIITLGGDGTNRAVSKGCGEIPLLPISTGTNNVFPYMIEGTIAGMAAGVVTLQIVKLDRVIQQTKRLEIERNDQFIDVALIDAVVYNDIFLASRALWNMSKVQEIVLTRAEPSNIGLSSIGGCLYSGSLNERHGIRIRVGKGNQKVLAPIAPGLIERIGIESYSLIHLNEAVEVKSKPSIIALDGEREIEVRRKDRVSIRLTNKGPYVINIKEVLKEAAQNGFFVKYDF
jgi:predicted polyphosphate/ATP-dependent NAD kinase